MTGTSNKSVRPGKLPPDWLLLVSILAIGIGLLLPAIPKIREAAKRQSTSSKLEEMLKEKGVNLKEIDWDGSERLRIQIRSSQLNQRELRDILSQFLFTSEIRIRIAEVTVWENSGEETNYSFVLTREVEKSP